MTRTARHSASTLISILFIGCASQTTPGGGPKDIKPPKLLSSIPAQKGKNFKAKELELLFDEELKLKNPKEEIIISPSPGKEIDYVVKKNKVIISPKQGWQDSTTYSLAFREAVQDLNEGNSVENLYLAFSTGPTIDSLSISGTLKEALSELIPQKITIAIYQSDTFDITKHAPVYFTQSDKQGRFKLENLKEGNYFIYAFEDKNKNLKVETQNEKFGFKSARIELTKNVDSITLALVKIDCRKPKISSIKNAGAFTRVRFNKFITGYSATATKKNSHSFGDDQREILIFNSENDSTTINLHAFDSLEQMIDTTFFTKLSTQKKIVEKLNVKYTTPKIETETGNFNVHVTSSKLISTLNLDSIYMQLDSASFLRFTNKDFQHDTVKKILEIKKLIDKKLLGTKTKFKPILKIGKGFINTLEADSSKAEVLSIELLKPENAGTLLLHLATKTKNYFTQLLDSKQTVFKSSISTSEITFVNIPASDYKIRILIDSNMNGKWDAGNIYKRLEPEPSFFYKNNEGKFEFPIRANWELGPLLITF